MAHTPRLIALAGASCSGKTTLARFLAASLPGDNPVLTLDAYYRDVAVSGSRILSLVGGQDAPPRGTSGGCVI